MTRKSDGQTGVVVSAWARLADQEGLIFVRRTDAAGNLTEDYLSPRGGELAASYEGPEVYAPEIERRAGGRSNGKLPACTSIGGYSLIYVTRGGKALCSECATSHVDGGNGLDPVIDVTTYDKGPDRACDGCDEPIESSYGNPGEDNGSEEEQ